jgi:hypothetical protein
MHGHRQSTNTNERDLAEQLQKLQQQMDVVLERHKV